MEENYEEVSGNENLPKGDFYIRITPEETETLEYQVYIERKVIRVLSIEQDKNSIIEILDIYNKAEYYEDPLFRIIEDLEPNQIKFVVKNLITYGQHCLENNIIIPYPTLTCLCDILEENKIQHPGISSSEQIESIWKLITYCLTLETGYQYPSYLFDQIIGYDSTVEIIDVVYKYLLYHSYDEIENSSIEQIYVNMAQNPNTPEYILDAIVLMQGYEEMVMKNAKLSPYHALRIQRLRDLNF
jgi:hypothetical protein